MSAFSWPVRIYWEDTDAGGVVYYANYLKFLERARTEWLRTCGFSQQALAKDPGIIFPVRNLRIHYKHPARLDDELVVSCEARPHGAAAISFAQRISSGAQTVAEAEVQVVCVDAVSFRPKRIPPFLMNALDAPEPH